MSSPSSAAGATRWRKRPIKPNPTTNRRNCSHEDNDNEDDETQNGVGSEDDENFYPNPNPNLNQNQQNQHNQSHTQLRIQQNQNTQLKSVGCGISVFSKIYLIILKFWDFRSSGIILILKI
ncbi:hypothetical protein Droror1_Dr00005325 [Drosera rotundifolia]